MFTPADLARVQQRKLMDPVAAEGGRFYPQGGTSCFYCGAPADALGNCLGTCGPDDDYHDHHPNA